MNCVATWVRSVDTRADHQRLFVALNSESFVDVSGSLGTTATSFTFPVAEGDVVKAYVRTYDSTESVLSSNSETVTATAGSANNLQPATGLALTFDGATTKPFTVRR